MGRGEAVRLVRIMNCAVVLDGKKRIRQSARCYAIQSWSIAFRTNPFIKLLRAHSSVPVLLLSSLGIKNSERTRPHPNLLPQGEGESLSVFLHVDHAWPSNACEANTSRAATANTMKDSASNAPRPSLSWGRVGVTAGVFSDFHWQPQRRFECSYPLEIVASLSASCNALRQRWFSSGVPIEMRSHSGNS